MNLEEQKYIVMLIFCLELNQSKTRIAYGGHVC